MTVELHSLILIRLIIRSSEAWTNHVALQTSIPKPTLTLLDSHLPSVVYHWVCRQLVM